MKSVRGLCLASLCLGAVFAFGAAASASAAPLLFLPENHQFPYHLTGLGATTTLQILGQGSNKVTSTDVHVLVLFLTPTLFHVNLTFLGSTLSALGGEKCWNNGTTGSGVINTGTLLGHLGLADHEGTLRAAGLILVGAGVNFSCNDSIIGAQHFLVTGGVIGEITSPVVNGAASELLLISYKQKEGVQLLRTILFGTELVTSDQKTSINGGAVALSGQEGHVTLHALLGQGPFLLISP